MAELVLVVDDVEVVRLVIARVLRRAGFDVIEAADAASALALAETRRPQVVLTDIWMPGMDGLGLIETLHARAPGVGVVAMSGGSPRNTSADTLRQAMARGAWGLLLKPVEKDEVVSAVRDCLEQQAQRPRENEHA